MSEQRYTDTELEVIGLKIAMDSIDSMVNREMLSFGGRNNKTEVYFPDSPHQKLFYILLADFLSQNTEGSLMPGNLSCMESLGIFVSKPLLANFSKSLEESYGLFFDWTREEIDTKVWAPSLDMELSLRLSRQDVINFAANMSKHHFGHLTAVTKKLYKQLDDQQRPRHDIIPALESIYGDLHDNILNYHSSAVAEMLNNLRWGIHDYLQPEFRRSYRKLGGVLYEFDIPSGIKTDFARSCYWDLMDSVRNKPFVNRFTVNELLKLRY